MTDNKMVVLHVFLRVLMMMIVLHRLAGYCIIMFVQHKFLMMLIYAEQG